MFIEIEPKKIYKNPNEGMRVFSIPYEVSNDLKDELDLYIEEVVGADGVAVIDDCTEEETADGFKGELIISFNHENNEFPFDEEYLNDVSSALELLSSGESLGV